MEPESDKTQTNPPCQVVPETVAYTPPWASAPWAHEMRRLFLEVVDYEEAREIKEERDEAGNILRLVPVRESGTAHLHLRAPNGTLIRVPVELDTLDEFFGLMMPAYDFKKTRQDEELSAREL